MRSFRTGFAAVALAALLAGPAAAGHGGEIGFTIGAFAPDEHLGTQDEWLDQIEVIAGLRGELFLTEKWGLGLDGLFTDVDTNFPEGKGRMSMARLGANWYPQSLDRQGAWFVSPGMGWMWVDMEYDGDFERPFASLGFGQRWLLGESATLRWELRADATFYEREDIVWEDMFQGEALVSLSFPLGRGKDTDGDGVKDSRDDCPDTPAGATVDELGCPLDADGDGVPDGIDTCADTPAGAKVDAQGCPLDADGDGVPDGTDTCADTPQGATVDAQGCPRDSDGDGVPDGIDLEAATMAGVFVDAYGRSLDADKDGVFDGLDLCPETPIGVAVDEKGCPEIFEEKAALVLEGVSFETSSDVLTADSRTVLDEVAAALKVRPDVRVEVGGYTDSQGAAAANLALSEKRAESVRRYLVGAGVSAFQLEARGYGEANPIADNETAEGRAQNRRVELKRLP